MQTGIFDAAKGIPASEIAQQAGAHLQRKGSRQWCCCLLHRENTASMCFYPDGTWYCHGCKAGGDSVDLYAALHHVTPLQAAQEITQRHSLTFDTRPQAKQPTARDLQVKAEAWQERKAAKYIAAKDAAAHRMDEIRATAKGIEFLDNPAFLEAQEEFDAMSTLLMNLDAATAQQIIAEMARESEGGRNA